MRVAPIAAFIWTDDGREIDELRSVIGSVTLPRWRLEYTRIVYFQCAPSRAQDRNTIVVSRVGFRSLNERFRRRVSERAINNPGCCPRGLVQINDLGDRRFAGSS